MICRATDNVVNGSQSYPQMQSLYFASQQEALKEDIVCTKSPTFLDLQTLGLPAQSSSPTYQCNPVPTDHRGKDASVFNWRKFDQRKDL